MENNTLFNQYIDTHNKMIEKNGYTEKSLWGSKESQQLRFKVMAELFVSKENFSVLDLGCGLCDFNEYLLKNGFENFEYTGVEINPLFIEQAKSRNPDINIVFGSVDDLPVDKHWDYVVASGIYNLGSSLEETDDFFISQFSKLYPNIQVGFAVNFLSMYSLNQDHVSIYHNPSIIIDKCTSNFSRYFKLFHDYLPHDFTVFVYKEKNLY